jgi:hypothetical protein
MVSKTDRPIPGVRAISRAQSFQNLKKGCYQVSSGQKIKAIEKMREALTEERPLILKDYTEERMLATIKSVVAEVFSEVRPQVRQGKRCDVSDCPHVGMTCSVHCSFPRKPVPFSPPPRAPFPSSRSHFLTKGKDGGAASRVLDLWKECQRGRSSHEGHQAFALSDLNGYALNEHGQQTVKGRNCQAVNAKRQADFADRCVKEVAREQKDFFARPLAIPEPLKVRVVTMGPEFSYWMLRDFQKYMWSVMKEHPTFRLIGETISDENMAGLLSGELKPDEFIVSGDFRDATNQLKSRVSNLIMKEIIDFLDLDAAFGEHLIRALTGHTLVFSRPAVEVRDQIARDLDFGTGIFFCKKKKKPTPRFHEWWRAGQADSSGCLKKDPLPMKRAVTHLAEHLDELRAFGWDNEELICRSDKRPFFLVPYPRNKTHNSPLPRICFGGGKDVPWSRRYFDVCEQKNGQLMGSPMSFPILCLANAVLSRLVLDAAGGAQTFLDYENAVEDVNLDEGALWSSLPEYILDLDACHREALENLRRPLWSLPLRINGDDVAFRSTRAIFELWLVYGKLFGLESSVGKTYLSPYWVQMNSQIFRINEFGVLEKVPYLNLGHLSPFDPKGGASRDWTLLSSLAEDFLSGEPNCKPERKDELIQWFLDDTKMICRTIPDGICYFLPKHLGGAGLPHVGNLTVSTKESRGGVSFRQLELAEYLRQDPSRILRHRCKSDPKARWFRRGMAECLRYSVMQPVDPRKRGDLPKYLQPEPLSSSPFWGYAHRYELVEEVAPGMNISPGNFMELFRKSKGVSPKPCTSRLGLYLGDPERKTVLRYGASEYLDDLFESPPNCFTAIYNLQPVRRVKSPNPGPVEIRKYGILIHAGSPAEKRPLVERQAVDAIPDGDLDPRHLLGESLGGSGLEPGHSDDPRVDVP